MSRRGDEHVGIVGLGAVGGSLALALGDRMPVRAWSRDPADRVAATEAGIDVYSGDDARWTRAMDDATMVVIAVPLDMVAPVVRELVPLVHDDVLLLHTASLQRREALGFADDEFARALGTHPMAGSERSGFSAARAALFRDATVRAEDRATDAERARIERLWRAAGCARVVWSDTSSHDALMAWVSHLPQLAATALGAVCAEHGVRCQDLGPGARDMTRLASSDPAMWIPLLTHAPDATLDAVRELTTALAELTDAVQRRDTAAVARLWERARAWRADGEEPS